MRFSLGVRRIKEEELSYSEYEELKKKYYDLLEKINASKAELDAFRVNQKRSFVQLGNACKGRTPIAALYAKTVGYSSLEKKAELEEFLQKDVNNNLKEFNNFLNYYCEPLR